MSFGVAHSWYCHILWNTHECRVHHTTLKPFEPPPPHPSCPYCPVSWPIIPGSWFGTVRLNRKLKVESNSLIDSLIRAAGYFAVLISGMEIRVTRCRSHRWVKANLECCFLVFVFLSRTLHIHTFPLGSEFGNTKNSSKER